MSKGIDSKILEIQMLQDDLLKELKAYNTDLKTYNTKLESDPEFYWPIDIKQVSIGFGLN